MDKLDILDLIRLGLLPGGADDLETDPQAVPLTALRGHPEAWLRSDGPSGRWRLHVPLAGLAVALQRLPFGWSPGRWMFRCPACGGATTALLAAHSAHGDAASWACRRCHAQGSAASTMGITARLARCATKATLSIDAEGLPRRRPNERHDRWLRRRAKATQAKAAFDALVERAAERIDREIAAIDRRLGTKGVGR